MKIKDIQWSILLKEILAPLIPIPALLIVIGLEILCLIITFGDAERAGLVPTQTTNNTLFYFTMINTAMLFIFTGIIYLKLNLISHSNLDDTHFSENNKKGN